MAGEGRIGSEGAHGAAIQIIEMIMDHGAISIELIRRVEELHIHYGITLTRHREWATEDYVKRLADVFEALPKEVRCNLHSLRDHKGTLEVVWKKRPTRHEVKCVDSAWGSVGCEESSQNEHTWLAEGVMCSV